MGFALVWSGGDESLEGVDRICTRLQGLLCILEGSTHFKDALHWFYTNLEGML